MPATELYTISVQSSGRVVFELSASAYTQALNEMTQERRAQSDLYKFYLAADLIKDNPERELEHALYLGEDICTVYEPGQPPKVIPFPSLSVLTKNSTNKLADIDFKEYVLAQTIGFQNLTILHHMQAYQAANPRQEVFIRYSDSSYRDLKFRTVVFDSEDTSPILYRYSATEQDNQITLRINISEDTPNARLGLEDLKRYATKLLATLDDPKDFKRWPKIEILGEGAMIHRHYTDIFGKELNVMTQKAMAITGIGIIVGGLVLIGLIGLLSAPGIVLLDIILFAMVVALTVIGAGMCFYYAVGTRIVEEDELGHEFRLMRDLPGKRPENARAGELYLAKNGAYVVRNTASGPHHNKLVEQGQIPQQTFDALLKGKPLRKQLKNFDFKRAILKITSANGHTCENVHERDLADYYAIHFAMEAIGAGAKHAQF